jgi:Arc/MetJ-type ribon-helix-helix transcriptional regulator
MGQRHPAVFPRKPSDANVAAALKTALTEKEGCNTNHYMRATLTVSLPEDINLGLSSLVKRSGKSRSQVVQEALRRQIALERFRDLREKFVPKGGKAGFHTDSDVFEVIS